MPLSLPYLFQEQGEGGLKELLLAAPPPSNTCWKGEWLLPSAHLGLEQGWWGVPHFDGAPVLALMPAREVS